MAIQYGDILIKQNGDNFEIFGTANGDLAHGNNKEHQIGAIVNADEGNFRKHSTMAARLSRKVEGVSDSREIVNDVVLAVGLDGWRIDELDLQTSNGNVNVTIEKAEKITDNTDSLV